MSSVAPPRWFLLEGSGPEEAGPVRALLEVGGIWGNAECMLGIWIWIGSRRVPKVRGGRKEIEFIVVVYLEVGCDSCLRYQGHKHHVRDAQLTSAILELWEVRGYRLQFTAKTIETARWTFFSFDTAHLASISSPDFSTLNPMSEPARASNRLLPTTSGTSPFTQVSPSRALRRARFRRLSLSLPPSWLHSFATSRNKRGI